MISFGQNVVELLRKIDQLRNGDEFNAPVRPAQAAANACHPQFRPSTLQGFGLWLNQPSQKQPLLNSEVPPQTCLINHRQPLDQNAGHMAQPLSTFASARSLPCEASQVENWRNRSNISGQEIKGASCSL